MKFSVTRRIVREDLKGDEIPKWIDDLLTPLNRFIEQTYLALSGNLAFADNFSARELSQKFTHGVAKEINPNSSRKVKGIFPIDGGGQAITSVLLGRKDNGNISITVRFEGGTTSTEAQCVLVLLFE